MWLNKVRNLLRGIDRNKNLNATVTEKRLKLKFALTIRYTL